MYHVAVAIIADSSGSIFLQHRDVHAPTNPNVWGLWGGSIDANESSKEAVARELHEELDIVVSAKEVSFLGNHEFKDLHGDVNIDVFFLKRDRGFAFQLKEGDDCAWFNKDELQELSMCPQTKESLRLFFT